MFKETPRSLRLFFGLVALLYAIMLAGAVSQVILLLRENPEARLSALFVAQAVFKLAVAGAFVFVVVKFHALIRENPRTIKAIVHVNFGGSLFFAALLLVSGAQLNYLGLLITVLVYVYLLRSVDRLSKELLTSQAVGPDSSVHPA